MESSSVTTAKKPSASIILFVMLIAMVSGAICMNKVAPVLTNIVSDLSIANETLSGLLISIFVFSGIFLSIPMGMLITKYGTFKAGLFALVAIIIGSALGAISGSYALLLVSRLIEGIGLMFLATLGPAAVANSFSDKKRGTAMGLLMCFMSFGQIIAFNIAPAMAAAGTWKNFWWVSAAFACVVLIFWLIFIRNFDQKSEAVQSNDGTVGVTLKEVLKNSGVWLVCITFFTYLLVHMSVFNYLPTYFSKVGGLSPALAGSITSIASLIGIPIGILGGFIADKSGSRKIPIGINMLLLALVVGLIPLFNSSNYLIMAIVYGIVSMSQAGLCFTAITEVVKANQGGTAAAALNTAQWISIFISTILFGTLLDKFGWTTSFYIIVPLAVIGALTAFFNKKLK